MLFRSIAGQILADKYPAERSVNPLFQPSPVHQPSTPDIGSERSWLLAKANTSYWSSALAIRFLEVFAYLDVCCRLSPSQSIRTMLVDPDDHLVWRRRESGIIYHVYSSRKSGTMTRCLFEVTVRKIFRLECPLFD